MVPASVVLEAASPSAALTCADWTGAESVGTESVEAESVEAGAESSGDEPGAMWLSSTRSGGGSAHGHCSATGRGAARRSVAAGRLAGSVPIAELSPRSFADRTFRGRPPLPGWAVGPPAAACATGLPASTSGRSNACAATASRPSGGCRVGWPGRDSRPTAGSEVDIVLLFGSSVFRFLAFRSLAFRSLVFWTGTDPVPRFVGGAAEPTGAGTAKASEPGSVAAPSTARNSRSRCLSRRSANSANRTAASAAPTWPSCCSTAASAERLITSRSGASLSAASWAALRRASAVAWGATPGASARATVSRRRANCRLGRRGSPSQVNRASQWTSASSMPTGVQQSRDPLRGERRRQVHGRGARRTVGPRGRSAW